MSKEEFKQEHMMKLQGKDYLPVAPRVVMFRQEHPDWSIVTNTVEVAGETYVKAEVCFMADGRGVIAATAHKRVRKDAKGPAALWPLETAETGAVGRALALCGYGTLAGDLDEGDELADAPLEPKAVVVKGRTSMANRVSANKDAGIAKSLVAQLDAVKTIKDFETAYEAALTFLGSGDASDEEQVLVKQAGTRARNRVAK